MFSSRATPSRNWKKRSKCSDKRILMGSARPCVSLPALRSLAVAPLRRAPAPGQETDWAHIQPSLSPCHSTKRRWTITWPIARKRATHPRSRCRAKPCPHLHTPIYRSGLAVQTSIPFTHTAPSGPARAGWASCRTSGCRRGRCGRSARWPPGSHQSAGDKKARSPRRARR